MISVGEILKKEREKQGYALKDIEKNIKIREKFLEAVESNNWGFFTSKIYVSGIIKNYSEFLGLDPKKNLAFFRRDYERQEDIRFKRKIKSRYLTSGTKKVLFLGLSLIFFLFFGYFGYQLKLYFSPPDISILSPKNSTIYNEEKIKIIGKTDKDSAVTISGERIYQNNDGIFEYDFPLHVGKNYLTIEVIGANGKKTIFKKEYIRKD